MSTLGNNLLAQYYAQQNTSAKAYIQDGLIALWDGIENIGYGRHDNNATEWIDLIGGKKLVFTNAPYFTNSALIISRISKNAKCSIADFAQIGQVETVVNINGTAQFQCFVSVHLANSGFSVAGIRDYTGTQPVKFSFADCAVLGDIHGVNTSLSALIGNQTTVYKNGEMLSGTKSGWSSSYYTTDYIEINKSTPWKVTGKCYCIRLYSRALTPEEIAYNYSIDRKRFNLP